MRIVTGNQMAEIDSITQDKYKISGLILMENAGIAITNEIISNYECQLKTSIISFICGNGNNAGDGLVIARQLYNKGYKSEIFLCQAIDKLKPQAMENFSICKELGIPYYIIDTEDNLNKNFHLIDDNACLLDAIFGTGLNRKVEKHYKTIIEKINNEYDGYKIAVDVPSGLICDIEKEQGVILKADHTITVALPKMNMIDFPYRNYIGKLSVVQIGFPKELLTDEKYKLNLLTIDDINLPKRMPNTHKGSYGHLLIIGSSINYQGACVLSASAALKTGCGLVTLCSIKEVCDKIIGNYPQVLALVAEQNENGSIKQNIWSKIENKLDKYTSILIGPGLTKEDDTKIILEKLLQSNYKGKIIIDADAINIISENKELLKYLNENCIITPHIAEMARLIDKDNEYVKHKKISAINEISTSCQTNIYLKDAVSLLYFNSNKKFYFSDIGNNSLAQGGSGDVLAGLIAGFAAYNNIEEASLLAAFIQGKSAIKASCKKTSIAVTLNDIIDEISSIIKEL